MNRLPQALLLLAANLIGPSVPAAITESFTFDSFSGQESLAIPDGSPVGLSDPRTIGSAIEHLGSVSVTLKISGGYNGDLYGYLRHDSGFVVLLNRAGVTATDPYGYPGHGLNVSLTDQAPNGDIHRYREVFAPAAGQPLTGLWQPDGRLVDPAIVLDTSPRTTSLAGAFQNQSGSGVWTLFLADLSRGGSLFLDEWGLQISDEMAPIPESSAGACVVALGLLAWVAKRRCDPRNAAARRVP